METVKEWLKRTHDERYDKCKNYKIISSAGYVLWNEASCCFDIQWYNRVMEMYIASVEETDKWFIVTAKRGN